MENTWMRQRRTSASFQRRKLFCFCFFTFCLLARPELLVAPDCLISPAAGNEAALEPLLSGHWTSSWKQLVGYFLFLFFFFFSLQKDLKVLHEQFMVEKPKPLKEPARFPRQHCDHLAVPLPTVSALPMGLLRSDTMLQRCSARAEHQEPFCSHGVT